MKRRAVAFVGSLVAVVVAVAAAITGTAAILQPDRGTAGSGMHQLMGGRSEWGDPARSPARPGRMHGAWAGTEFGYLTNMVAHHGEAVAAATELQRSDRPQMRALGRSIVTSQSAQIQQMNAWLDRWYAGSARESRYRPMMRDLSGVSGDALDRAFLQDMIPHHMMAVASSQHLLGHGLAEHDEVNDLARSIRDEQHTEMFWMRDRLAEWFGTGWGCDMGFGTMR